MAKVKKKVQSLKEKLLAVIHEANAEYVEKWESAWAKYKTIIGPFVMGTATYLWTLIYGSLYYVGKVIYGCGKVLLDALLKLIEKA